MANNEQVLKFESETPQGVIRLVEARPVRKVLKHTPPLGIRVEGAYYFITITAAERGGTSFVEKAEALMRAARYYHDRGKWQLALFLVMPDHLHMIVHVSMRGRERGAEDVAPDHVALDHVAPDHVALDNVAPDQGQMMVGGDVLGAPPHTPRGLAKTIGDYKSYLAKTAHIAFQRDFFDTRIRNDAHYAEKWNYILNNPVAKGLVATADEWRYRIVIGRGEMAGQGRGAEDVAPDHVAPDHGAPDRVALDNVAPDQGQMMVGGDVLGAPPRCEFEKGKIQ